MRCDEVMKRQVHTCTEYDTIERAAQIMRDANVGFLPVCDRARKCVGAVTDRDIVIRAVADGRDPKECRVAEIRTREVISCRQEDDLDVAERLMVEHQKSRILVTDRDDTVLGVISLSDIAQREPAERAGETLREVASREATRGEIESGVPVH